MGKTSKTKKTRAAGGGAAPGSSSGDDKTDKSAPAQVSSSNPASGQALTPPQFTALITLAVLGSTVLTLRRASSVDGVGSELCSATYADDRDEAEAEAEGEGKKGGCTESDVFFFLLRYHRALVFVMLYVLALLICWKDSPLLQRLNHCLCLSPVGATVAGVASQMGWLNGTYVATTGITYAALFVLTNQSYRAPGGVVQWRRISSNVRDLTLAAVSACAAGYGAYVAFAGPSAVVTTNLEEGGIDEGRGRAQLVFVGIECLNVAVLVAFVLFFLEDSAKRVMMFGMGVMNLFQVLSHLPMEKDHLAGAKVLNDVLCGSAVVLLLCFAIPLARSTPGGTAKSD